jgi:hypothetical protein
MCLFLTNLCDVMNCHNPISDWIILARDNEVECDSECYIERDRKLALCSKHAIYFWDALKANADTPVEWIEEK